MTKDKPNRLTPREMLVGFVVAILAAFAFISYSNALSVDQTRIMSKRQYANYQPIYQRFTINWNDPGIANGQLFGALGLNDFIQAIDCHVTTAFNAGTTNLVTVGTTKASPIDIIGPSVANGSITAGTPGIYHLTAAVGLGLTPTSAADNVQMWAKYAQTGTAATAGAVTCVMKIISNNDN